MPLLRVQRVLRLGLSGPSRQCSQKATEKGATTAKVFEAMPIPCSPCPPDLGGGGGERRCPHLDY